MAYPGAFHIFWTQCTGPVFWYTLGYTPASILYFVWQGYTRETGPLSLALSFKSGIALKKLQQFNTSHQIPVIY